MSIRLLRTLSIDEYNKNESSSLLLPPSITPKPFEINRRQFIAGVGTITLGTALSSCGIASTKVALEAVSGLIVALVTFLDAGEKVSSASDNLIATFGLRNHTEELQEGHSEIKLYRYQNMDTNEYTYLKGVKEEAAIPPRNIAQYGVGKDFILSEGEGNFLLTVRTKLNHKNANLTRI